MDLWFTAFTSRWVTTMWLGDDLRERPLGKDDAAFMSAVPSWARYMARPRSSARKEIRCRSPKGSRRTTAAAHRSARRSKTSQPDATRTCGSCAAAHKAGPRALARSTGQKLAPLLRGTDAEVTPVSAEGRCWTALWCRPPADPRNS